MLLTDSSQQEAGVIDFIYVCKKQPFSITCSPYLPKIEENYVDLDLVLKMNIPIKNIQCTRLHYAGHHTKVVGQISQTVQCVVAGKTHGTAHLKAKVVRDLSKLFQADCVAGYQLYNKLMDPSFATKKDNSRRNNTLTSKQLTGTKDTYSNISTVVVNDTCDDNGPSQKVNDSIVSEDDRDDELSEYLAKMTADAQADAVADYPELARHIKQVPEPVTDDDDELRKFFSTQSEDARLQAVSDYPELKRILQNEKDEKLLPKRFQDPVLGAISKQGLGPTDARIMSINANTQPHMLSSMPAVTHHSRQLMVDPTVSALSYPSNFTSDLGKPSTETKDAPLSQLMAHHGYHDQDSLNDLAASHGYHDQDSLQDLAASHGYHDSPSDPDLDQVSLHSDTAEFFCRLCQRSGQPAFVTFSHDFMDPSCPSMYSDEEEDALES